MPDDTLLPSPREAWPTDRAEGGSDEPPAPESGDEPSGTGNAAWGRSGGRRPRSAGSARRHPGPPQPAPGSGGLGAPAATDGGPGLLPRVHPRGDRQPYGTPPRHGEIPHPTPSSTS